MADLEVFELLVAHVAYHAVSSERRGLMQGRRLSSDMRDEVATFLTSHSGTVVEYSLKAADDEVEKHAKLPLESRESCRECLQTIYLGSISLFEGGRKFEECDLEPLREVGTIYAEAGFSGDDVVAVPSAGIRSRDRAGRRLRRIANGLERMDVLWSVVGDSLALLVPNSFDKATADMLHNRVCADIEVPIVSASTSAVSVVDIPEVIEDCVESISTVRHLKYPPGCYDTRRILFERIVLSADPEMLGKAKWLMREIASETKLAETLAAWITYDGHRTRVARMLDIHLRTLDYRLRRIRSLAGFDPADPSAMPVLRCASIAWLADLR
ncbi:helix-turn-helix domain-containing protein [Nocardia vaccinii]|uniref:helix-turn-helix domain-containing protein n=1 Tax=Nocardia vaccinii TaxID=1822 RepID=UPI001471E882|nr:helix-turn-helix domain-containing protein [Nocardia vaccinii]